MGLAAGAFRGPPLGWKNKGAKQRECPGGVLLCPKGASSKHHPSFKVWVEEPFPNRTDVADAPLWKRSQISDLLRGFFEAWVAQPPPPPPTAGSHGMPRKTREKGPFLSVNASRLLQPNMVVKDFVYLGIPHRVLRPSRPSGTVQMWPAQRLYEPPPSFPCACPTPFWLK
jgi:hypothetical protein